MMSKFKNFCWKVIINPRIGWVFKNSRQYKELSNIGKKKIKKEIYKKYFSNNIVHQGPFKGLIYPSFDGQNFRYLNKLAGTYESELHDLVKSLKNKNFKTIINIGSAEGYYACGFAKIINNSNVIAYDILESARIQTLKMAEINNLESRVEIKEFADQKELLIFPKDGKTLIIVDCEGYESKLFSGELTDKLSSFYFLIETHDCFVEKIHGELLEMFDQTHNVLSISSNSDHYRVKNYKIESKPYLSNIEKFLIFSENRLDNNHWIYCEPKI